MEVIIEKLSNLGLGIVRVNGQVVFVENACPGDVVRIEITHKNKNFSRGRITEIMTPSPHRVKPRCAIQKVCGACQLQFIDYDYQLELKRRIVQDAMCTIGGIVFEIPAVVPSPEIFAYRCKIQYPVAQRPKGRLLAGYYKTHSHEIVNIKHCPIQPEICGKIVDFIRSRAPEFGISGYDEKTHTGNLRHIVIRSSAANGENLVVPVVNEPPKRLNEFAQAIFDGFEQVSGVCVNFNPKRTNVILGAKTQCLAGKDFITETVLGKTFKIGADTFFQVNPKGAENIFAYVRDRVAGSKLVLDAYAGISAFGACVSDVCEKVVSVEENPQACELAREMDIKNLEIHNEDAAEFLKQEKRRYDAIILDPPRKGCTQEALDEVLRLCRNKIVYVSCNPATLARDLKYLVSKGAKVESIQPFDMFCHTYHIESVAVIAKS